MPSLEDDGSAHRSASLTDGCDVHDKDRQVDFVAGTQSTIINKTMK